MCFRYCFSRVWWEKVFFRNAELENWIKIQSASFSREAFCEILLLRKVSPAGVVQFCRRSTRRFMSESHVNKWSVIRLCFWYYTRRLSNYVARKYFWLFLRDFQPATSVGMAGDGNGKIFRLAMQGFIKKMITPVLRVLENSGWIFCKEGSTRFPSIYDKSIKCS